MLNYKSDAENRLMKGKRISLRTPEPSDIDRLYAWENDTSVWRVSNTIVPYSRNDIEQFVLNTHHDIYAAKQLRLMIIKNGRSKTPAGAVDLFDFDPLHRRAGVGILIDEKERGKGLAGEALNLLRSYSFNTLNLHQLYCHIATENTLSIRLFSKAGFEITGTMKDWTLSDGHWHDVVFMQLINS